MNSSFISKITISIILATLISCNNEFDKLNSSLERSNKVFLDSNLKVHNHIIANEDMNTESRKMADSLLSVNDEANELIDKFKEEITNLQTVGRGNEHAQQLFASPFTFAPLVGVVTNVDAVTSMVMKASPRKLTLDSALVRIRELRTDSLWSKKFIKGANENNIIMLLSDLQTSCSKATNLALVEIDQSLHP